MDESSIAHTKCNCKYHIVFTPKYRRRAIYGELKAEIGAILRKLCKWKGGGNNRGTCMCRSCTYVCVDTYKNFGCGVHGFSKREKYADYI